MILTTEQMKQWIDETWTEAQKVAWALDALKESDPIGYAVRVAEMQAKASADQVVRAYESGYKAGYKAGAAAVREVCAKALEQAGEA